MPLPPNVASVSLSSAGRVQVFFPDGTGAEVPRDLSVTSATDVAFLHRQALALADFARQRTAAAPPPTSTNPPHTITPLPIYPIQCMLPAVPSLLYSRHFDLPLRALTRFCFVSTPYVVLGRPHPLLLRSLLLACNLRNDKQSRWSVSLLIRVIPSRSLVLRQWSLLRRLYPRHASHIFHLCAPPLASFLSGIHPIPPAP